MKKSDAQSPQFEAKWWANKKASKMGDVDANDAFKKLLKQYEKDKTSLGFQNRLRELRDVSIKIYQTATKLAKATSIGQGETKLALQNYAKSAQQAVKKLEKLLISDELALSPTDMLKKENDTFKQYFFKNGFKEQYQYCIKRLNNEYPSANWIEQRLDKLNIRGKFEKQLKALFERINNNEVVDWSKEVTWSKIDDQVFQIVEGNVKTFKDSYAHKQAMKFLP